MTRREQFVRECLNNPNKEEAVQALLKRMRRIEESAERDGIERGKMANEISSKWTK